MGRTLVVAWGMLTTESLRGHIMRSLSFLLGLMLAVLGCVDRPTTASDGSDSDSTTTSPTTTLPPPSTTTGTTGSTTMAADSTGTGSSDDAVSSAGFLCSVVSPDDPSFCSPDGGLPPFECNIFAQDCPAGEKCMPWANDGGLAWNGSRCSPLAPDAAAPGEPCIVEGSAVSGIDSCDASSMCWDVDPSTNEGVCVPMGCGGDETNLQCDQPGTHCAIYNEGAIVLCLPDCDPLAPACDPGQVCIPAPSEPWTCVPGLAAPAIGGEPCEFGNVCDPGSVCAQPWVTAGCGGVGCCAPTCDTAAGLCADGITTCEPWYPPGRAPAGLEGLGLCSAEPAMPKEHWLGLPGGTLIARPSG